MAEADEGEVMTLYEAIVSDCKLKFDPGDGDAEDYKESLVVYYGKLSADDYEKIPDVVHEWVAEATDLHKANRTAKRKKALPDIEGLPEDEGEGETAKDEPPARRARSSDKDKPADKAKAKDKDPPKAKGKEKDKPAAKAKEKAAKTEPKGRDPTATRYYRGMYLYLRDPKLSDDESMVAAADKKGWEYSQITGGRMVEASVGCSLALKDALDKEPKAFIKFFGKEKLESLFAD